VLLSNAANETPVPEVAQDRFSPDTVPFGRGYRFVTRLFIILTVG